MNRLHHALLAPLIAVLAVLLGLAGSASAAFNAAATEMHYGEILLRKSEASGELSLQLADPTKGNGVWVYDGALGVPVYVKQNPWTMFDPLGLKSEHEKKWADMAANDNVNAVKRIGASLMAAAEGMNPFRSDSSLRDGGRDLQKGMAEGRERMKEAPPVIREIGQFAMGVGSAGTAPLTMPAAFGEIGDSVQQQGVGQTAKNMATGFVEHVKNNPMEFAGEAMVGWATGKAMAGSNPAGASARATQGTAVAEAGTETVQRWMSRAELEATDSSGLLRGGRDGTHYVTDAANSSAQRARLRTALPQTPEVRATLEVPGGTFSAPTRVQPAFGMPGGGMERTATGPVPVKILKVDGKP